MLIPSYTNQFSRDIKKMLKRGKSERKIKQVIRNLINEKRLDVRYKDHRLAGNYRGRRECHIEPDWLLIYKTMEDEIIFERTGTHSDLFE
ncbi:MAG: type II toxin-antitoxin system YafQ family toxin [Desulfobacteraceae bacterium]|nr:type II toxin-antitoxin system YafQ family toxin [Desulfobacteraceae bacterium]